MARVSIEDCQKKMDNRFELVLVAAARTRQLMGSSVALIDTKNKHGVTALREIAEGKIVPKPPEEELSQELSHSPVYLENSNVD